jgi:hypothetical protein
LLVPTNWLSRSRRSALGAALCIAALGAALVASAGVPACAQGRLEAEYVASVSGIPIGRGSWVVEISNHDYTAAVSGSTAGLLQFFSRGRGSGSAHGTVEDGKPLPTSYAATIIDSRHIDDVHISLSGGDVTDYTAEPPLLPNPDRIPVTAADRRGVIDPITSALARVAGTGDPVSPQACNRDVPIFDGRVRFDLRSEFKRMETVRAEKGYQGAAVVCALYFRPISGYEPGRAAIKYLVKLRDAEVWLAPIAGTRVLALFRFYIPTPLGPGVLQAKQFVSVAQPAHPLAKAQ